MNFTKITTLIVALMLTLTSASAQDLIARQVPIDRKLTKIDSLTLVRQLAHEEEISIAEDLYQESWENEFAHVYSDIKVPENYRIDLRGFVMPTPSRVVTSGFKMRWGRMHKGLDIDINTGDTIVAAFSGKVRVVKYDRGGYGNYVVIRHPNGLETIYGHLSKHLVTANQDVRAGEPIGLGGNTGRSYGSHLHFETRIAGVAINPAFLFDFKAQDVTGDFYEYHSSTATASTEPSKSLPTAKATSYYKIRKGDTLSSIAKKYRTTVANLCKLNGMTTRSNLSIGKVLRVS